MTALKAGALDAALIALPYDSTGLEMAHVADDELLAAAPADHAMAGSDSIAPEFFDGDDLILLEDGHCLRDHALSACSIEARTPDGQEYAATSLNTLVQMVGSGLGVSLLPAMAVKAGLAEQASVIVRPFNAMAPSREIVVVWRAGSSRGTEARLLAETLKAA